MALFRLGKLFYPLPRPRQFLESSAKVIKTPKKEKTSPSGVGLHLTFAHELITEVWTGHYWQSLNHAGYTDFLLTLISVLAQRPSPANGMEDSFTKTCLTS